MECDICAKARGAVSGFHCATCAFSSIYTLRVEYAATLLDKESLGRRVEAAIANNASKSRDPITLGNLLVDTNEAAKTTRYERTLVEVDETRMKIDQVMDKTAELKRQLEEQRQYLVSRRATVAQRRRHAESARHGLATREARQLDEVQGSINRTKLRHDRAGHDMTNARVYLCREAADLMRLRARKVRRDDGGSRYFWSICNHEIPDLRSLNSREPRELSAVLNNTAHLLGRVSSYLGLRLPAEITLPHNNYPLSTIFRVPDSYRANTQDVLFPGTTVSTSGHNSPAASRTLQHQYPLPSPRLLWTDKRLPQLAKEDTASFARLVEGCCLMAWDVAWLCRTQGQAAGVGDGWEDVCPVGRNLYRLLLGDGSRRTVGRQGSADRVSTIGERVVGSQTPTQADSEAPTATSVYSLGVLSHGTTGHFLEGPAGVKLLGEWKLKSANEVSMKVRQVLVSEIQGAEWEIVEEEADEFGDEVPELIKGPRVLESRRRYSRSDTAVAGAGGGSAATAAGQQVVDGEGRMADSKEAGMVRDRRDSSGSAAAAAAVEAGPAGKVRGASGWTKVKSRSG